MTNYYSLSETNCTGTLRSTDTGGGASVTTCTSPDAIGVSPEASTHGSLLTSKSVTTVTMSLDTVEEPILMTSSPIQAPDSTGLVAAVISVIIVLFGLVIVLVIIVLLVKKRY